MSIEAVPVDQMQLAGDNLVTDAHVSAADFLEKAAADSDSLVEQDRRFCVNLCKIIRGRRVCATVCRE